MASGVGAELDTFCIWNRTKRCLSHPQTFLIGKEKPLGFDERWHWKGGGRDVRVLKSSAIDLN